MLIIIRGLPGGGKSTLAKMFERDGYVHLENDQFRARSGEYVYDPEENELVRKLCFRAVKDALRRGRNVVLSNALCELKCVQEYTMLARRYGHDFTVIEAKGSFGSVMGCDAAGMEERRAKWEHYPV